MLNRRALLIAATAATLLSPALAAAQTFPIKLVGQTAAAMRGGPVAVPSYQIAYFTQQQGTASGGVLTKARLTTTLVGIPEATMRRLVDEAHADLVAQFKAAGIATVPEAEAKAALLASGVELAPNNAEITSIGATVTIGKGVKKAYAAFGAKDAPMVKGLQNPGGGAMGMLGARTAQMKLGESARAQKAVFVMPSLNLDFAATSASAGRDFLSREAAGVSADVRFGIAPFTGASLLASSQNGRFATPGLMYSVKEITTKTPFATVATGEGAVRALSVPTWTDSNYIERDSARGDAVVVNVPVWEGLVRQAYKDFNASIVAEFKKAWKPA